MDGDRLSTANDAFGQAMANQFPTRVSNVLRACGIDGIGRLLDFGRASLLRERNMGVTAIAYIDEWLKATDDGRYRKWMASYDAGR